MSRKKDKISRMGKLMKPEHRSAFEKLKDEELYTVPEIARLAPFSGTVEEIRKKRRNFRVNLNGFYRERMDEEPDHVQLEGHGAMMYPAWTGKAWKAAAGVTETKT